MGVVEVIGLALSAVSVMNQRESQQDAADARKKAERQQAAATAQERARERRQQLREERIKRAQIMQASATSGTSGSSGELGAEGSLSTQLGSNIGHGLGMDMHARKTGDYLHSANVAMGEANTWGSVSSIGMNIFQNAGKIGDVFSTSGVPTQPPAPVSDATINPVG